MCIGMEEWTLQLGIRGLMKRTTYSMDDWLCDAISDDSTLDRPSQKMGMGKWFYCIFSELVRTTSSKRYMVFYEADLRYKISICISNIGTNFQVMAVFYKPEYIPRTFSPYPFVRLCILTLGTPTFCASNMHVELHNIISFTTHTTTRASLLQTYCSSICHKRC